MWKCQNCGRENQDNRNHCWHCSTSRDSSDSFVGNENMTSDKSPILSCPNCGKNIKVGDKFCNFCGMDLRLGEYDTEYKCSTCGSTISKDSNFCSNCGSQTVSQSKTEAKELKKQSTVMSKISLFEEEIAIAETQLRQYERELKEAKEYNKNSDWGVIFGLAVAGVGYFIFGGVVLLLIGVGIGALAFIMGLVWSSKKNNAQKKIEGIEEEIINKRTEIGKLRAQLV